MTTFDVTDKLRGRQSRVLQTAQLRQVDRDADGTRYLSGMACPYDTWTDTGWYFERLTRGMFAKSIKEAAKGLPLMLSHDQRSMPIGISEAWEEQNDGLYGVWRVDHEDPRGSETLRKADQGFLTSMSVGFLPIENWQTRDGERIDLNNLVEFDDDGHVTITRKEARLLEVSVVATPAYVGANILEVRDMRDPVVQARRGTPRLDQWRKRLTEMGV